MTAVGVWVCRWRDCFSDEHYMPSLIAYKQLGHETDCVGRLVGVDWSLGGAHPRSYTAQDINPDKWAGLPHFCLQAVCFFLEIFILTGADHLSLLQGHYGNLMAVEKFARPICRCWRYLILSGLCLRNPALDSFPVDCRLLAA